MEYSGGEEPRNEVGRTSSHRRSYITNIIIIKMQYSRRFALILFIFVPKLSVVAVLKTD